MYLTITLPPFLILARLNQFAQKFCPQIVWYLILFIVLQVIFRPTAERLTLRLVLKEEQAVVSTR